MTKGAVTRIRVPSTFASLDNTGYRYEVADFKLGRGPCGKEVVHLQLRPEDHGFEVVQETRDGEVKTFIYPTDQLTARIEVTCGVDLGDDIEGNPIGS